MSKTLSQPSPVEQPVKPATEKWLLGGIFLLALALRLFGLDKNGFCNTYYAATVRSMLVSWHNFFFDSFDPMGYVTVDKPPVAFWVQAIFAKLFGYKVFVLILPQVLEGLCSIGLLYYLVRRRFGAGAALLAALAMAFCPIAVAVDRYNNTDGCLVMILLGAACFITWAAEQASLKHLLVSMLLVGIGFNTKMVVAFIVLPTFYLLYFLGAPAPWRKRFLHLALASVVLAGASLAWPLAFDFTPPGQRPFAGSTEDNSMISLSLGWNGLNRVIRGWGRGRLPHAAVTPTASHPPTGATPAPSGTSPLFQTAQAVSNGTGPNPAAGNPGAWPPPGRRGRQGRPNFMGGRGPGFFRLADSNLAGQMGWFLPLCLIGWLIQARREKRSLPLSASQQPLILWGGWFLTYWAVFSFMQAGPHPYYLVMLAPALSAMAGIGVQALWRDFTQNPSSRVLPLSLLAAGAWQAFIVSDYPDWGAWLIPGLLIGLALALTGFAPLGDPDRKPWPGAWEKRSFALGLCVLSLCPFAWALTPVLGRGNSVQASPDLISGDNGGGRFGGGGAANNVNTDKLLDFLRANYHGEKYMLVAQNSMSVSPLIIRDGAPVIALGGFMGADPTCTLEQFERMAKEGQFRYALVGGMGGGNPAPQAANGRADRAAARTPGAGGPNPPGGWGGFGFGNPRGFQAEIAQWVRENGKPVEPHLWRVVDPREANANAPPAGNGFPNGFRGRGGGQQLYDLRPSS